MYISISYVSGSNTAFILSMVEAQLGQAAVGIPRMSNVIVELAQNA
jgi:hypothetical protein